MEDSTLIRRLKHGDTDTLRCIYETYENDMLATAIHLIGDRHTAMDVVHDVFVAFVESIHKRSLHGALRGYLIMCVINKCRDWRRSPRRKSETLPDDCPAATTDSDPAGRMIAGETALRLSVAMAELPYEQREVVLLHLRGGMRFKDIAGQLNTSINTVQSRYRYGLEKLRSLLDGEVEQ